MHTIQTKEQNMQDIYGPCSCNSGKKFKFCCNEFFQNINDIKTLQSITRLPLYNCYIGKNFQETGLASIIVARGYSADMLCAGNYLVDTFCLGLKETYHIKSINDDTFEKIYSGIAQCSNGIKTLSYESARSIILGGIQYAASLGFKPQEDWKYSQYFIEPHLPYEDTFKFGKDGKPFYVAGPYENHKTREAYIAKVIAAGGDWVIPIDPD